MSPTTTSSVAASQAASASQSSSGQTFSGKSESIETAISGLTSLVEAGRSAADTGRSSAANYIQGAMDLYASMGENETLSIEELKERLRLSEDQLIRDLADDSLFLGKMDVEPGHGADGKVSKSAAGDFLMNAYGRVNNILNGELTEAEYNDLTVLAAEDAALGQGILGKLSGEQRQDLSERIAEDGELVATWIIGGQGYYAVPQSERDFEKAKASARELAPDADAERQNAIAHILYDSVTSNDYNALKKLFAEDPSLGAKVLEVLLPQQAQISEHLSSDLEWHKNPEDWSKGFRSLVGKALPASPSLLSDQLTQAAGGGYAPPPVDVGSKTIGEFLSVLRSHFGNYLDTDGDSYFSRDDLQHILKQPGAPPDLRAAAEFFLEAGVHPAGGEPAPLFEHLDRDGDGLLSLDDLAPLNGTQAAEFWGAKTFDGRYQKSGTYEPLPQASAEQALTWVTEHAEHFLNDLKQSDDPLAAALPELYWTRPMTSPLSVARLTEIADPSWLLSPSAQKLDATTAKQMQMAARYFLSEPGLLDEVDAMGAFEKLPGTNETRRVPNHDGLIDLNTLRQTVSMRQDLQAFDSCDYRPWDPKYAEAVSNLEKIGLPADLADPIKVCDILLKHWDSFDAGDTINLKDLHTFMGGHDNPAVRGALAYVVRNTSLFNALDAGSGGGMDGRISRKDIGQFKKKSEDDLRKGVEWYQAQDNSDPSEKVKNKQIVILMAAREMADVARVEDEKHNDGRYSREGLQRLADRNHNPDLSSSLRDACLWGSNPWIYGSLDTGIDPFWWDNDPDNQADLGDTKLAGENLETGLTAYVNQRMLGVMKQAVDDGTAPAEVRKLWDSMDRLALLRSAPLKALGMEESVRDDLIRQVEDEQARLFADKVVLEWLTEKGAANFDSWLPPDSQLRRDMFAAEFSKLPSDEQAQQKYLDELLDKHRQGKSGADAIKNAFDELSRDSANLVALAPPEMRQAAARQYAQMTLLLTQRAGSEAEAADPEAYRQTQDEINRQIWAAMDPTARKEFDNNEGDFIKTQEHAATLIRNAGKAGISIPKLFSGFDQWSADEFLEKHKAFIPEGANTKNLAKLYNSGGLHLAYAAALGAALGVGFPGNDTAKGKAQIAQYCLGIAGNTLEGLYKATGVEAKVFTKLTSHFGDPAELLKIADEIGYVDKDVIAMVKQDKALKKAAQDTVKIGAGVFFKSLSGAGDAIGTVLSALSAKDAFAQGDGVKGAASVVQAVGSGAAVVGGILEVAALVSGAAAAAGPVGVIIGAVGAIVAVGGSMASLFVDVHREREDDRDWKNDADRLFADQGYDRYDQWNAEKAQKRKDDKSSSVAIS